MNHFWVSLLIFSKDNEVFSAYHKMWILCWGQQHGSGSYAIAKSHWRGKIFLSSEHYILFGPYFCYVWCGINNVSTFILPYVSSISLCTTKPYENSELSTLRGSNINPSISCPCTILPSGIETKIWSYEAESFEGERP